MSTTFQISCELHEVDGPRIHRSHGAVGIWPVLGSDIFDDVNTREQWNTWLLEHEDCPMKLERQ